MADPLVPQDGWMSQLAQFFGGGNGNSGGAQSFAAPSTGAWTPPNMGGGTVNNFQMPANNTQFGANIGTGQLALQGLGSLGNLWSSFNQNKLAKEQFDFQKNFANTNLNNSIKSYNTTLEDRLGARGVAEGRTADYTQDQIARNRLAR